MNKFKSIIHVGAIQGQVSIKAEINFFFSKSALQKYDYKSGCEGIAELSDEFSY